MHTLKMNERRYLLNSKSLFFIISFNLIALVIFFSGAQASVMLDPTRIVLDNRNNTAKLTIINHDGFSAKYRITTAIYRYQPNGALVEVTNPSEQEQQLKLLVRYSPKQTTMKPKERQIIRLMFRKTAELAEGEYRIHLKVSPVLDQNLTKAKPNDSGQSVKVNILVGISIPIIIRNGELWVEATPVACRKIISKQTGKPVLAVDISRIGNRSAIVDIKAYHLSGKSGSDGVFIGRSSNAAIYTQYDKKTFHVPLEETMLDHLKSGLIRIELSDSEKNRRKGKKLPKFSSKEFDITSTRSF